MINESLMGKVKPWIEQNLGVSLSDMDEEKIPIVPINNEEVNPLRGIKIFFDRVAHRMDRSMESFV